MSNPSPSPSPNPNQGGASLFDPVRHQVVVMNQVFSSHRRDVAWSSKAMLQVIQAKVETRQLFDP